MESSSNIVIISEAESLKYRDNCSLISVVFRVQISKRYRFFGSLSTGNIADASSTDIHLLNAIHSIHSLFAGNENKVSTSKGGMAKIQEHFQRRVAGRLFQFEQKCIAELNSKMNKHIETLSTVLNGFTQNCLANPQK